MCAKGVGAKHQRAPTTGKGKAKQGSRKKDVAVGRDRDHNANVTNELGRHRHSLALTVPKAVETWICARGRDGGTPKLD